MTLRSGLYIVPTHRWYIERTVWLIAGLILLVFTLLAALDRPLWVLAIIGLGLTSVTVSLTGFCAVGNVLRLFGFTPMLGASGPTPGNLYFMQTDRWYLERRIYLVVGINLSVASVLVANSFHGCSDWRACCASLTRRFVGTVSIRLSTTTMSGVVSA